MKGGGGRGASAQGNPTPGAGLQGEGKAEASRACWTGAGDGAQLGKPSGAQGTRGARTRQLRGPRRTAAPAALEDPRLHCGRQLRSPGGPEGLRLQSAGSTRLAWPGWQAEGSPGVWWRFANATQRGGIAQEDPLLWGCDLEESLWSITGKFWGWGTPRRQRREERGDEAATEAQGTRLRGSSKLSIGQGHLKQEFATASTALFNKFVSWEKN